MFYRDNDEFIEILGIYDTRQDLSRIDLWTHRPKAWCRMPIYKIVLRTAKIVFASE